jgi:hypothetical protein
VIALVVAVVIGPPVPAVAGELPGDELIEIGGKVENATTRSRPDTEQRGLRRARRGTVLVWSTVYATNWPTTTPEALGSSKLLSARGDSVGDLGTDMIAPPHKIVAKIVRQ